MKAVILAGGEGTRLRPLTLTTPKPVVPIVDRPLLQHQLELLASVGVRDIVFSVAYKPERVQAVFGDGTRVGCRIHYAVEETPLGTGGAVRNALDQLDDVTIVLNGDILTSVDLPAVIARHRETRASATLVLTPVPDPAAFGLVETDDAGRIRRFVEKPDPSQITTNTINAGIYVLDSRTLELIPPHQNHSIERGFFPALIARGDVLTAHVHRGYWIDIGTPEKYLQVHRDILAGRFPVKLSGERRGDGFVHQSARVADSARLAGAFYVGPDCRIEADASLGDGAVLVGNVRLDAGAEVADCVLWDGVRIGPSARLRGSLLGNGVQVGRNATLGERVVLGEGSIVSDFSRSV